MILSALLQFAHSIDCFVREFDLFGIKLHSLKYPPTYYARHSTSTCFTLLASLAEPLQK